MDRLITCVPNFSEGRSRTTVRALIQAVESVPGVVLLDHTMDADHHRSVLTFVGRPEAAGEAAFRAIRVATDLIDLRKHDGVHPRVGATDVVPFVPVRGVTMRDCVQLAKRLGQRVGQELEIPVFLYEQAAAHPDHAPLESVRRGGLEGLAFRMHSDPDWLPDFGPPRLHKTAGAVVIGARPPLIAFNVNLRSTNLELARTIARTIRQSNGGLPHVKAIGVELASRRMVQVAMNLTDYRVTPVHVAFETVQAQASLHGVTIAGSEVIGLVPEAALVEAAADALRLEGFDAAQVLETKIDSAFSSSSRTPAPSRTSAMSQDLRQLSLSQFLDAVAAATPSPAGASVSAMVSAFAASLGMMGARLSRQRVGERQLSEVVKRLSDLAQADGGAYRKYLQAAGLPKTDPNRPATLSSALHVATEIPLEIAELSGKAGTLLHACLRRVKPRLQADTVAGLFLVVAAGEATLRIARENLKAQSNQQLKHAIRSRIQQVSTRLEELRRLCYTPPPNPSATKEKSAQASPEKVRKRNEWKSKSSITTSKRHSRLRRKSSRGKDSSGN
ncbi:MAG: glutamate formimidoyltransferase [Nitrospira sp. CR1.3]|nr:glutamate formimidoyltransferase [Nitrospira sp. CR1.3]